MLFSEPKIPQSAARARNGARAVRFSALQRAENSSIVQLGAALGCGLVVSVLFSEPKIPQLDSGLARRYRGLHVSVLFSEPKIPQSEVL